MNKNIITLSACVLIASVFVSSSIIFTNLYKPKNATVKTSVNSTTEQTVKPIKQNISFEVNNFELKYTEDTPGSNSAFQQKQYAGTGFIVARGDAELLKKTYYVILKINKVKGGAEDKYNQYKYPRLVLVQSGSGTFETDDNIYDKNTKLEKPEYEFKILGYIPVTEQ